MNGREWLILLLFAGFSLGTLVYMFSMLERKSKGRAMDRERLIFFFLACLLLVCLVPVWLAKMLKAPVLVGNLCAVGTNLLGFALTYSLPEKTRREPEDERSAVRTYQVYYQGQPLAIMTREGFELLRQYKLLKKQRTVELIDNYLQSARQQGVIVQLLQNEDRSRTLIKVEVPEE